MLTEAMKKIMGVKANDLAIRAAGAGRHQVADKSGLTRGLYLVVNGNGSRRFLWRYVSPRTGKPNEAGLGSYPLTTLADARETVVEWRNLVRQGIDPIADRRAKKSAVKIDGKTLRDALVLYGEEFKDRAGAREGVRLIERHASALLTRPIGQELTAVEVKAALMKVIAATPKTAVRTRAALSALFSFAIGHGWRQGNPCDRALWRSISPPAPRSVPYRMMPLKMLPDFWRRLLDRDTMPALALAFTVATAARQAETTGATWGDFDLDARLWIVPGDKMKMGREHRQPLNDAALDVLARAKALGRRSSYVFPGLGGGRMGSRTMETVMHRQERMSYSVHATARAAFSTFGHEMTDHPHELIELSLAHIEGRGNSVSRSYNRSDALDRRRQLMEDWGAFLTGGQASS
jgi:integrase